MRNVQYKVCPRCGQHAALNSPGCTCGHIYSTNFTQAFTPQTDGPRDSTEWKLNVFWFWVGVWVTAIMAYTFCRSYFIEGEQWSLVATVGALGGLTFFGLRLRRLYVYSPFTSRMGGVSLVIVVCLFAASAFGIEQGYLKEKRLAHALAEPTGYSEPQGHVDDQTDDYSRPRTYGEPPR